MSYPVLTKGFLQLSPEAAMLPGLEFHLPSLITSPDDFSLPREFILLHTEPPSPFLLVSSPTTGDGCGGSMSLW